MRNTTAAEANEFYLDSHAFGPRRTPIGPADFGDRETEGLHLKRKNKTFYQLEDGDFGIFLGERGGEYAVLTSKLGGEPCGCEAFETLEELKRHWTLD